MYLVDQHRAVEVHSQPYRQRILIVEDDVTAEPLWKHVIQKVSPNATYRWVSNVDAAEYLIRKHHNQGTPFDLVISDVFLSGQRTGIDLWQRLGEMVPAFLAVSIIPHEKFFKLVGNNLKAPRYIQKPLNPKECIEVVSDLLDVEDTFEGTEA